MPALRSFRAAEGVRPYDTSLRANATRGKRATRSLLASAHTGVVYALRVQSVLREAQGPPLQE